MSRSKSNCKFNEATRAKIIKAIKNCAFLTAAAAAAGIDRRTIYRWRDRGEEERAAGKRTAYAKFVSDLEVAEGEAEFALVQEVKKKTPLEILKRRYRDKWGDSIKAEHTGADGGPIALKGACTVNLIMEVPEDEPWRDKEGNPISSTEDETAESHE